MPTTTTRLALVDPIGADAPSEFRVGIAASNAILDNAAIYTEGTLAARPLAGAVEHGHLYGGTDTGLLYQSNGTIWRTAMLAGAWTALTLGTGVTAATGYTPSARLEGDIVRLKGAVKHTGSSFGAGNVLATLPSSSMYPASTFVDAWFDTVNDVWIPVQIDTGGGVTLGGTGITSSAVVSLNGRTFTLT